jgi:ATP-dependent HslUV protease ATP-binding subunit HslU
VEASKFTEVGYVGRDVESMIRDLTEAARGHGAPREAGGGAGHGPAQRRGAAPRPAASPPRARELRGPRGGGGGPARPGALPRHAGEAARAARAGQLDGRFVEVEVRERRSRPSRS